MNKPLNEIEIETAERSDGWYVSVLINGVRHDPPDGKKEVTMMLRRGDGERQMVPVGPFVTLAQAETAADELLSLLNSRNN